jgi:hypothetical protein
MWTVPTMTPSAAAAAASAPPATINWCNTLLIGEIIHLCDDQTNNPASACWRDYFY